MYKWYQVLAQDLDENVDETLAWLTQKTEDRKSNKGNLTFPTQTVNVIELNCKVVKKVATLYFYINPPFYQKISYSPSDSIFGRSYPYSLVRGFPTMSM